MPIFEAVSRKNAMADVQKNEIVRFRDGDRVAFEVLYQRYWRKVLSFTRLYIKDSYEQEEVVQQVFIRLWENRTKVDAGKDFDGFLFIVTRNLIFNRARHSFTAESLADFIDGAGPEFYHDKLLLRNYKVFFKIRANTSSRKLRATGTVCLPTIIRLPSIISIFSKFIRYDLWTC